MDILDAGNRIFLFSSTATWYRGHYVGLLRDYTQSSQTMIWIIQNELALTQGDPNHKPMGNIVAAWFTTPSVSTLAFLLVILSGHIGQPAKLGTFALYLVQINVIDLHSPPVWRCSAAYQPVGIYEFIALLTLQHPHQYVIDSKYYLETLKMTIMALPNELQCLVYTSFSMKPQYSQQIQSSGAILPNHRVDYLQTTRSTMLLRDWIILCFNQSVGE